MQNRLLNIRKLVGPERWFYVPTSVNPGEVATKQTVALVVVEGSVRIGDVIDCRRFGNLSKLLNVTSYVYRFVNNFKARLRRTCQQVVEELTLEYIQRSKLRV